MSETAWEPPRTAAELLAQIDLSHMTEADSYGVVTIDEDDGGVVNVVGPFPDSLSAFAYALRMENASVEVVAPGEQGFRFVVAPIWPPSS